MTEIPESAMKAARDCANKIIAAPVHGSPSLAMEEIARALLDEREACARWHDMEISALKERIRENDEYAARHMEGCSTANSYCRDAIRIHMLSAAAIRAR